MATQPLFLADQKTVAAQILPRHGTRPRVIWTAGSSGSQIKNISFATNENASNNVTLWYGKSITPQSTMGTGTLVDGGAGDDTITRDAGSFIDDGWEIGNRLLIAGATTIGNDLSLILTGVAQLTLSFATATLAAAEALPTGSILYRLHGFTYAQATAGAGAPSVAAVKALNATNLPIFGGTFEMGPADILAASAASTLDTGEVLDILVEGGDY